LEKSVEGSRTYKIYQKGSPLDLSLRRSPFSYEVMANCHQCDFPVDPSHETHCRKCGAALRSQSQQGLLEIDIAHAGETWEIAKRKIDYALDDVFRYGHAGLKVIHGYGSTSGKSIIGPRAISYLRHIADDEGGTFAKDQRNPGASLLWLNR